MDFSVLKYALHDITDSIEKNLDKNPETALLLMHTDVETLIKYFFRLSEKWQVPAKKTLGNLEEWDKGFAERLKEFVKESDPKIKFEIWKVLLGKVRDLMNSTDNGLMCDCVFCQENIKSIKGTNG
jgi:hypothetical protein